MNLDKKSFTCGVFLSAILAGIFISLFTPAARSAPAKASPAPLGSMNFAPSMERAVGWRGDGTGRFPSATPPISWERTTNGNGYINKGIVWMVPLPNIGVGSPIIVGDKIFLTSEVYDLVCLDKKTGRVLWIRSSPEFEGLSAEDRKTNSVYAEKLTPFLAELTKANNDAVEALNAKLPTAMTAASRTPEPAFKKKRDLEKQIMDEQIAIDKKNSRTTGVRWSSVSAARRRRATASTSSSSTPPESWPVMTWKETASGSIAAART